MDSAVGILIFLFTGGRGEWKENDKYYQERKHWDLEILSECFFRLWIFED